MNEQQRIDELTAEVNQLKKDLALSESKREFLLDSLDGVEKLWLGCFKKLRSELETENEQLKIEVETLRNQLKADNFAKAFGFAAEPQAPYGK